jgi:hypothetical protein
LLEKYVSKIFPDVIKKDNGIYNYDNNIFYVWSHQVRNPDLRKIYVDGQYRALANNGYPLNMIEWARKIGYRMKQWTQLQKYFNWQYIGK